MSSIPLLALVAHCRTVCRPRLQAPDAELLSCFVHHRDAAAFEELLERYAPLVWGVCRRIAPTEADSEDAFQATFLALVRQANRLDERQPLGGWLHTVALRLARKAASRVRRQDTRATLPERATTGDVVDDLGSRELFRAVDEEIDRLPALLRGPVIQCCLQGRTRDEAAETLGCSVAAVKSRLERGRHLLRRRLARRGLQLPAALLALGLTSERIRAGLWAKTMQAALYTPAPALAALAEAGVSTVTMGKCKLLLAALLVSSAAGVTGSLLTSKAPQTPAEPPPQAKTVAQPNKPAAPQVRRDRHGDALPDGAIARLGTVRWRHGFFVYALAYSPDGKKIAAVGVGRAITLWDSATGKEIRQSPNDSLSQALAFSPDGRILATTGNPSICRLWDVATGKELRQLKGHRNSLCSVAFAPDGKTLATSSDDGTARIWDASSGKELHCLNCKQGNRNVASYSPDGKLLATGGEEGTIRLWDPATGKEQRRLEGHKKAVWYLVFSPDGKHLASSSEDGAIRLWDLATGWPICVFEDKPPGFRAPLAFSPDGTLLAFGRWDGTIHLCDVKNGGDKRHWHAGAFSVLAIAFSPDGKTLAAGTAWDGGIRRWDVATGQERHPSGEHHGFVDFVRFSADGASLLSLGRDRSLLHWDLATSRPQRLLSWTGKHYSGAALSPDGNTVVVSGWPDAHLRLWDVRTGKPGRGLGKPRDGVFWAIAFSPDGRLVASESEDHGIHIWDVRDGKEIQQIKSINLTVRYLLFSPDSKALASGCGRRASRDRSQPCGCGT
jgi:RNA polymerase sigma factor (sigma-70 family)